MMKARPARGLGTTLDEALGETVDIADRDELLDYLLDHYEFWRPKLDNISIEKYGHGPDDRCGWDTHLVCVDGHAALFTDGPLPGERLRCCLEGQHSFTWRSGLGTCRYCFAPKRR